MAIQIDKENKFRIMENKKTISAPILFFTILFLFVVVLLVCYAFLCFYFEEIGSTVMVLY